MAVLDLVLGSSTNKVECSIDDDRKKVIITSGNCESKEQFLNLFHEAFVLCLINQTALHISGMSGCIDPTAHSIIECLVKGRNERAYTLARDYFHMLDDYDVLKKL